ncbi:MAG: hypothetical protein LBL45_10815 [Treponema sp.]|nr:hypothetical protein [Treponema sp.]
MFTLNKDVTASGVFTPTDPTALQIATLKIDGASITIPVPAENVNAIHISAVASNGAVVDFSDPSGILAGKIINLTFDAPAADVDGKKKSQVLGDFRDRDGVQVQRRSRRIV